MARPKKKTVTTEQTRTNKEQRLFDNLLRITQQFMTGKGYVPMTQNELMARLSLPPQHETIFHDVLNMLVKQKMIQLSLERYSPLQKAADVITGTLRLHPRGFGFLQADPPALYAEDVFIPKHLTKNAVDGDRVEVVVNTESVSEKGPEGKVVSILSRGRTHIAAIIMNAPKRGDILAYAPTLGMNQHILVERDSNNPLTVGDRVILEVIEWGEKDAETYCRFSHHLGNISDPSCDVTADD